MTHAFVKPGKHTGTLVVTDFNHRVGLAVVTVLVLRRAPKITNLKISKGKISYRDSLAGTTTFTVLAHRHGHLVAVRTFKHRDRAGLNRLRLRRHGLTPGPYRLRAVPGAHGETGAPAFTGFRG